MAINVRNIATGDEIRVSGIKVQNGTIVPKKGNLGERFLAAHAAVLTMTVKDGSQVFTLNDGYELVSGGRKSKVTSAEKPTRRRFDDVDDEPKSAPEPKVATEEIKPTAPAKKAGRIATAKHVADVKSDEDDAAALVAAIKRLKGGSVDEQTVRTIVRDVLGEMLSSIDEPKVAKLTEKVVKKAKKEYFCRDFDDILQDVKDGYNVYLYGAAGSGKSHTAEQIAERLGLDFYGQTTIQFAHDVRGYGDAGGNFCETPFFKAFANGGLYFQDEYDRSNAEAAIVLNSALANGWYDFPIIGRVKAHPNFRFMAAGNTLMKGADEEYVSGQPQDASCRDRFGAFYECEYSHEVELNAIANGDEQLVSFIEDVRHAIKSCGLQHIVSYRATAYMVNRQKNMSATVRRCTFKGLEIDEIREIYGALQHKENAWAVATKKLF